MENSIKEEVLTDEEAPFEDMTLEVTIPESSTAGDIITIECPNKSFVQFVTPENVVAGDTVHVVVNESSQNEATAVKPSSTTSYQGVAAVTTGVIVSSLVIGPIVTGVLVVGMVVYATQRKKSQTNTGTSASAVETKSVELMEEGNDSVENLPPTEANMNNYNEDTLQSDPETRERKIAAALVKTADYIVDKVSAIDDKFAITGNTLKAIATVQEIDERNKFSETIITNIKHINEKYSISETAGHVVNTTITKAQELDESCKLTENLTNTGSNLALCMTDFERRYDISTRITTSLLLTISTVSEVLTQYINRITSNSTTEMATNAVDTNNTTRMEGVAESFSMNNEDNTMELGGAAVELSEDEPEREVHDSQNPDQTDMHRTGIDPSDIRPTATAVPI